MGAFEQRCTATARGDEDARSDVPWAHHPGWEPSRAVMGRADGRRLERSVARACSRMRRAGADLVYFAAQPLGVREGAIIVWAGMRGAVTLAAAPQVVGRSSAGDVEAPSLGEDPGISAVQQSSTPARALVEGRSLVCRDGDDLVLRLSRSLDVPSTPRTGVWHGPGPLGSPSTSSGPSVTPSSTLATMPSTRPRPSRTPWPASTTRRSC